MNNIYNQPVLKKANHKLQLGLGKLIASGFIIIGLMAIHAPVFALIICSVGIVPAMFTGILNIKQGHDLKTQLNNPVEEVFDLVNENDIEEYQHDFYHEIPSYEKEYQKVKVKIKR